MTSGLFSTSAASGRNVSLNEGVAMGLENLFMWLQNHLEVVIALLSAGVAIFGD